MIMINDNVIMKYNDNDNDNYYINDNEILMKVIMIICVIW